MDDDDDDDSRRAAATHLPELGPDLVSALPCLNVNDLPHILTVELNSIETNSSL
jgi:hypothetical protein